jgi:hypothetical protein
MNHCPVRSAKTNANPRGLVLLLAGIIALPALAADPPGPATPQQQIEHLTGRLIDVYSRLYVATPETQRDAMLADMIADPVIEVRLLALSLIERKVLNAQPIEEPLRAKFRPLLDDGSPKVRARTASLLRTLDDQPAVAMVLQRLKTEPNADVINAHLSLLARQPTAAAIDRAIALLTRPATSAEAAELLIRAIELNKPTDEQKTAALNRAVTLANNGNDIEPAAVRLVGRLATENQAALLKKLLDHSDEAVRLAAADAFVLGTLSFEPLFERLADPVLGPKAVDAAARQGKTLKVALALLKHEPKDVERRKPWRSAIAAIAGRLSATDLVKLDDAALAATNHEALRPMVLKTALALPADAESAQRTEMLLRLGESQVAADQTDAIAQTLSALDDRQVSEKDQGRLLRLRIEHQLRLGRYDEALKTAEAMLEADRAVAGWLTAQLLDAVENALGARKTEQAGVMMVKIEAMLGEAMSQSDRQRYDKLRLRLTELMKPDTPDTEPAADN